MKPRRYPYTGRLKKPARLIIKEWQQYYDNHKGHRKEPINLLIDPKEFSQHSCEAIHGTSQEAQEL